MSNIEDLIVIAEEVGTGNKFVGYVCGCNKCSGTIENEKYDRPVGLLTSPDCLFSNVRVYTDNMLLYKFHKNEL